MKLGLLLGGGGAVGIAWESGVLAGLADGCGFDASACDVIVGTSAGSAVGAAFALGQDPHDALDRAAGVQLSSIPPLDLEKGPFAEILQLMLSGEARTPEGVTRVGELAVKAETSLTEEQFVEMFRQGTATDEWPTEVDLRCTTTQCSSGKPTVWTADDGIGLARAVASSCAIPGFFPTVSFEGERYMDAMRGRNYHATILDGLDLDAVLFVGPKIGVPGVDEMIRDDMATIAKRGVRVHTILGSERMDAAQFNLMDVSKRGEAFEIGVADGRDAADVVAELLN